MTLGPLWTMRVAPHVTPSQPDLALHRNPQMCTTLFLFWEVVYGGGAAHQVTSAAGEVYGPCRRHYMTPWEHGEGQSC